MDPVKRTKKYELDSSKVLSAVELKHLEMILERNKHVPEHARDCLLLEVLLKTGARASEALNLKVRDLRRDPTGVAVVHIHGIKGSDDREIPVKQELFSRLLLLTRDKDPSEAVFDIKLRRLQQIWDVYKPAKKKLHALRHTFAHRLFSKHKDLMLVQVALGHRSIHNTLIYARYSYRLSELKRLIA